MENESTQKIDMNSDKIKDEAIKDTETSECAENKSSSVDNDTMNANEQIENSIKNDQTTENNCNNIESIEEKADVENNEKENIEKMESMKITMSSDSNTMIIENEKIDEISDDANKAEERIEKPISPPIMEPPPKPPRQKSGTDSNSSTLPSTPVKNDDTEMITEMEEKIINELKEDCSSIGSIDTQKTRSAASKRGGDDDVERVENGEGHEEINKDNSEEKIEDQDIIDDADDVQSPASKTG